MSDTVIKWAEIIPTMCGNAVAMEHERESGTLPALCDTEAEILDELVFMQEHYDHEIEKGERDKGDVYEGYAARVSWDGENLFLIDDDNEVIERVDWRAQL